MTESTKAAKNTIVPKSAKGVSQEVLDLKKEIEGLKAQAEEKLKLQEELETLKATSNRTGGKKLKVEMANYEFTQIMDPGISFTGTHGHPKTEGGRNTYTRYCCEDGDVVELPVVYAEELNMKNTPHNKLQLDDDGNHMVKKGMQKRWTFTKVI